MHKWKDQQFWSSATCQKFWFTTDTCTNGRPSWETVHAIQQHLEGQPRCVHQVRRKQQGSYSSVIWFFKSKSFISNFNDNYRFIRSIAGNDKSFVKLIHKIMNILGDDKLIQLSILHIHWWDILDLISHFYRSDQSAKYFPPYSILIDSKETSHMINCFHLKSQPVYPLNQIDDGHDLYSNSEYKYIWIFNENGEVKYKKMKTKEYTMGDIEESENECQDTVWCCKPTRVCDIDIQKIDWLYYEIERGNISHNAERFVFSKEINLSIDEYISNSEDIEKLHKFFSLFDINSESWIQTEKLIISYLKEQRKQINLRIAWGNFLLFFKKLFTEWKSEVMHISVGDFTFQTI